MPWGNRTLLLYHGTIEPYANAIQKQIDLAPCEPRRDFGKGFYTTRIRSQARRFAIFKYREALFDHQTKGTIEPQAAALVEMEIHLDALAALETLAFVQPTADWRSFTAYCRKTGTSHKPNNNYYRVVYGPVGSSRGALRSLEQMSFHDDYSISLLRIVKVDSWTPP
jgi:hypothetical protein